MYSEPPPLPGQPEPSLFARQAANACIAAPLITIALAACLSSLLRNQHDGSGSGQIVAIAYGLVYLLIIVAGCILGVLALALARPGQRGSVIPRVVIGYVLVGLMMAIAIPNFLRARRIALQQKQALTEMHAAAQDYKVQALEALTNSHQRGGINADQLQRSLGRAADQSSGETASILRASQMYLAHMQAQQRTYENSLQALLRAKVLSTTNLVQRSQIGQRKALVQGFLNANDQVKSFVEQGENNFQQELASFAISPEQTQAALEGFRKSYSRQVPSILAVREADDRMGRAMLSVLDLLDAQWGRWRYDTQNQKVRFENTAAVGQYNEFMSEIKQAGIDQAAAQQRLATIIAQQNTGM